MPPAFQYESEGHMSPSLHAIAVAALCVFGIAAAEAQAPRAPATGDKPAAASAAKDQAGSAAAKAALEEFRAAERALDKQYARCTACKGKGKIEKDVCADCSGFGVTFTGKDYQKHIDGYVAYCDLLEQHAAVLAADKNARERVQKNREQYLYTIERQMGTQAKSGGLGGRHPVAALEHPEDAEGEYNRLARELTVAVRSKALDHGIAFTGKVRKLLGGGDAAAAALAVAEVRIDSKGGESRTCYVCVPAGAKWDAGSAVRVVGRIVEAAAERKAAGLDADAIIVAAVNGTR
jgi:hypothetical protein